MHNIRLTLCAKRVVWVVYYAYIVVEVTMNMAKYISIWQSATGAAEECQYLNQLLEDLKVIFLTETKCKIRFVYVGFNCNLFKHIFYATVSSVIFASSHLCKMHFL